MHEKNLKYLFRLEHKDNRLEEPITIICLYVCKINKIIEKVSKFSRKRIKNDSI